MTTVRPVPRRVFVVWFGPPMNENRLAGLRSIEEMVGVEVVLIDKDSLERWIDPEFPLHPAFDRLIEAHRADYLRCYLLHVHGGGYTDVKPQGGSWIPAFDGLDSDPLMLGAGYRERFPSAVAHFGLQLTKRWELRPLEWDWWRYRWLQLNYRKVVGQSAMMFRPRTVFTQRWYEAMLAVVEKHAELLELHPGRYPKERSGAVYGGEISRYPVRWTEMLADIFHPLCLKYTKQILQLIPPPMFDGYQ